jgi:hypothetical protein
VPTKIITFEAKIRVVTYEHIWQQSYCWDIFLVLQIYEEAQITEHETIVTSFEKCGIGNAVDNTEDFCWFSICELQLQKSINLFSQCAL